MLSYQSIKGIGDEEGSASLQKTIFAYQDKLSRLGEREKKNKVKMIKS